MSFAIKSKISLALLVLLAACGGGGGGGDGGGTPVAAATPLAITAANYEAVAQQSVTATTYLMDTGGFVTGAQLAPREQVLINFSRAQITRLGRLFAVAPRLATGVTTTETQVCSGGGLISSTINDMAGNQMVDAGDSASVVASNCVEFGATINGAMGIEFRAVSGNFDGDVYSATVVMTLSNLQASTGAGQVSGNGSITLALAGSGFKTGSLDMTITSLTMIGRVAGVNETLTLQDWRIVSNFSPSGAGIITRTTVNGTLISAAQASQSVTVATVTPFVQSGNNAYPASGQFIATGANGSKIRVTAQNATTVLIELDADGNNVYEASRTRLWSDLG